MNTLIARAKLRPQIYGIAMAQCTFGGPRGIWLECTTCNASDVIEGSSGYGWETVGSVDIAKVFRRHGWTGRTDRMLKAKCPKCSAIPRHERETEAR
jgi:hypothetical protein